MDLGCGKLPYIKIVTMRKATLLILSIVFCLNCSSQIFYEQGYYIDNSGQRVDCQINNKDWKNSPTEFDYRVNTTTIPKTMPIQSVSEFGIEDGLKYVRRTVKIDKSRELVNNLQEGSAPVFEEETLFLKALIEGEANLFVFEDGTLRKYFYSVNDSEVEQLVYRQFKTRDRKIRENLQYKKQLFETLSCPELPAQRIKNLKYSTKDLVEYFVEYHECRNAPFKRFSKDPKKNIYNLNLRPGLKTSFLEIKDFSRVEVQSADFGRNSAVTFGLEFEVVLPFRNNKWAVILEPTYQSFNKEITIQSELFGVQYTSIEIPVGGRHYFFLSKNSKLFINAAVAIDFEFDSYLYESAERKYPTQLDTQYNFVYGIGFKQNDKFSIELRYQSRDILRNYQNLEGRYNNVSVLLGYTLFQW